MLKGSLKEKSKLMKKLRMRYDEKVLISVFHEGMKIGEHVLSVNSVVASIPENSRNGEMIYKIEFNIT